MSDSSDIEKNSTPQRDRSWKQNRRLSSYLRMWAPQDNAPKITLGLELGRKMQAISANKGFIEYLMQWISPSTKHTPGLLHYLMQWISPWTHFMFQISTHLSILSCSSFAHLLFSLYMTQWIDINVISSKYVHINNVTLSLYVHIFVIQCSILGNANNCLVTPGFLMLNSCVIYNEFVCNSIYTIFKFYYNMQFKVRNDNENRCQL